MTGRPAQPDVYVAAGPCDLCGRRPARVDEDPETPGEYVTTGLCERCLVGIDRCVAILVRGVAAQAVQVPGQLELDPS